MHGPVQRTFFASGSGSTILQSAGPTVATGVAANADEILIRTKTRLALFNIFILYIRYMATGQARNALPFFAAFLGFGSAAGVGYYQRRVRRAVFDHGIISAR
jgi:hypothetical protein